MTAAASSLAVTGAGMATSAADIVIKPIQAFSRSPSHTPDRTASERNSAPSSRSLSFETTTTKHSHDDDIYGRPAALDLSEVNLSKKEQPSRSAEALRGSASGVGGFFKHFSKGFYVDMPLAVSEGLRNAPRLYGGDVYDPGRVTDWKTGGAAAGKNFAHGIVEGLGGLVMNPVEGAKKDGALGAAKGAGVGLLNLGTKMGSGLLGLTSYTAQGLYLSARTAMHRDTRRMVTEASWGVGEHAAMTGRAKGVGIQRRAVVEAFNGLARG